MLPFPRSRSLLPRAAKPFGVRSQISYPPYLCYCGAWMKSNFFLLHFFWLKKRSPRSSSFCSSKSGATIFLFYVPKNPFPGKSSAVSQLFSLKLIGFAYPFGLRKTFFRSVRKLAATEYCFYVRILSAVHANDRNAGHLSERVWLFLNGAVNIYMDVNSDSQEQLAGIFEIVQCDHLTPRTGRTTVICIKACWQAGRLPPLLVCIGYLSHCIMGDGEQ